MTSNLLYNAADESTRLIDLDSLCTFSRLEKLSDVTDLKKMSALELPGALQSAMGYVLAQVICAAEVWLGRIAHDGVSANATIRRGQLELSEGCCRPPCSSCWRHHCRWRCRRGLGRRGARSLPGEVRLTDLIDGKHWWLCGLGVIGRSPPAAKQPREGGRPAGPWARSIDLILPVRRAVVYLYVQPLGQDVSHGRRHPTRVAVH